MTPAVRPDRPDAGALAANILGFVRLLRQAGLALGTGSALDAIRAVEAVGLVRRDDFYWALHAVLVGSADEHALFEHAFALYWRGPRTAPTVPEELREGLRGAREQRRSRAAARRLADALAGERATRAPPAPAAPAEVDMVMTYSGEERLRTKDFEQMSAEELALARRAVARLAVDLEEIRTRRWRAGHMGRVDMRATLRATLRSGHGHIPLRWRMRLSRPPALVALCDISGSMERYSRILLHFLHAVVAQRTRVSVFLFGTRLTNVTRLLEGSDPDEALARVGSSVQDWSGGTRIGAALAEFNLRWSRRLLGQGAVVLLITDGLDREGGEGIRREARRLRLSCRRLLWLNPLLRFEGFEPLVAGIRALLPEVDEHRPVHDLASVEQLVHALSRSGGTARRLSTRAPSRGAAAG